MFIHDAILEATTAGATEVERERIGRYVEQELGEVVEKTVEEESEEGEKTQETLLEKQFRVRENSSGNSSKSKFLYAKRNQ